MSVQVTGMIQTKIFGLGACLLNFHFIDSTSSTMTLIGSNKTLLRLSNEDKDYIDDFDNDEEDEWKPKKKKRRKATTTNNKTKKTKKNDLLLVVSPSTTKLDFPNCIIPFNQLWYIQILHNSK